MSMSNTSNCLLSKIDKFLSDKESHKFHLAGVGSVFELENKLADCYGKKYALTFSSASQAMFFLAMALEIKGKEVVSSPLTWGGSISPFDFFGGKIVFSELDFDNYCLSPDKIINKIRSKTRIILSTDYAGNLADTFMLSEVARAHNLFLISDSAQSFGAFDGKGKPAGFYADAIVLSFGPTKSLFGGEGGAVITESTELFEKIIWLSQHLDRQKKFFPSEKINFFGFNGRMHPLSAMIINENWVKSLRRLSSKQKQYFHKYSELVKNGTLKKKKSLQKFNNSTYWLPIFELKRRAQESREDKVREFDLYNEVLANRAPGSLMNQGKSLMQVNGLSAEIRKRQFVLLNN